MAERDGSPPDLPTTASKLQLPVIEELNLYVNSKIAKIIATGVVIVFITYHGFLHAVDGGDSCQRLLSDGRFQGALVWQPYGCMLHTYSNTLVCGLRPGGGGEGEVVMGGVSGKEFWKHIHFENVLKVLPIRTMRKEFEKLSKQSEVQ
ncbi:N-acetylneuraminate 9-O-acetyltransferase [Chionoecetes opilio]|uniref:N-acetylneuraminate 9-O-acetyltransferase n=1 Tax=Chionoecetes opilio TaxID=41210 RepID=A0A8J4YUG5_CHIOP|nr:N-acetylneuraminate 9-O-acetyltransferase [Chionoecetes opilio]